MESLPGTERKLIACTLRLNDADVDTLLVSKTKLILMHASILVGIRIGGKPKIY